MTAKKVPHLPPYRYRSEGKLVDYEVSVKNKHYNTKETTGFAYNWDNPPSSISDNEEITEELMVEVKSITVNWEDYEYQVKEAQAKEIGEDDLLEAFYNYTESDGWKGVHIEYKPIYQKDKSWSFFIRQKEKEKLFHESLSSLINPTQYFWGEIKDRIILYAASYPDIDLELFKMIDCISFIFSKKWELGKGECAANPDPDNFSYPLLEPASQARSLFNNAFMLVLSEEAKNIVDIAYYPIRDDLKKKIIKVKTVKDLFNLIEENIGEVNQQDLKLNIFLRIYSHLSEKGFEIKDIISALKNKTTQDWAVFFKDLCERKRTYFPSPGAYTSDTQLIESYHEIEAQEIFGHVWEAYYGFDALFEDFQKSFEFKEKHALPIDDKQISKYSTEISQELPTIEAKIDQIKSSFQNDIKFWDNLTPVTQERIADAYYYEKNNRGGGDFEPAIMKFATALENELTEQLLDTIKEKYPDECRDLQIHDTLKIEVYKRLLEKYGYKIFFFFYSLLQAKL